MKSFQHDASTGHTVPVLYVDKRHAKQVKTTLETKGELNKDFRMVPGKGDWKDAIAVPVGEVKDEYQAWNGILGSGTCFCPFSTSLLGNQAGRLAKTGSTNTGNSCTLVEQALLANLKRQNLLEGTGESNEVAILKQIRDLGVKICPKKLEYLGDDRTLVVQRRALSLQEPSLVSFLESLGCNVSDRQEAFLSTLWQELASTHKSPRVVRRGEIPPSSGIRESNYRLLWPITGVPDTTGPGSPAWITVTEQGIRQSFDMTRVMFSRGNITEKIRFGKLVQRGDIVLDLYGGIGYFTLPALVHGEAEYVYACEWNPEAVKALRFNLSDNGVAERATVLDGDCRVQARNHNLVNMFDRVSLGLLPSSEGGWWTAVQALRRSTGGWLHVHGNVPVKEIRLWTEWLCRRLLAMSLELDPPPIEEWSVICTHVEKVKSFAPTVNHYVADVFLGNPNIVEEGCSIELGSAGVVDANGKILPLDLSTPFVAPSCTLAKDGVLHQDWMLYEADA